MDLDYFDHFTVKSVAYDNLGILYRYLHLDFFSLFFPIWVTKWQLVNYSFSTAFVRHIMAA